MDLVIDLPMDLANVGLITQLFKLFAFLLGDGVGSAKVLEGGLCYVIVPMYSAGMVGGGDHLFLDQAHDGLEEVVPSGSPSWRRSR